MHLRRMLVPLCGAILVAALAWTANAQPAHVPAGCAEHAPAQIARNPWAPARHLLAPKNTAAMTLCRYSGLNAHPPLRLTATATISTKQQRTQIVHDFDQLPKFPRAVFCPADDGSQIDALLSYADGHHVTIQLQLTGCSAVTNGDLTRTAAGFGPHPHTGPHLVSELERLLRRANG